MANIGQSRAQCGRLVGKCTLVSDVFSSTFRRLDPYRHESKIAQIVRTGSHIDDPDLAGEFVTVGDHFAAYQRRKFICPLIDIHVGVQASRLFVVDLFVARRLQQIQRPGGIGKESECVEMTAPDLDLVDERRSAVRP